MSDRCQGCKMLRMTVWLCIMILNGSVTLSGSPFDCLWHSFLVNLRIWDDWWKLLYQNCNFRNMLLVPRNLSAIFRSRSSLLYTGTTGPCLDEMSPPLKRVYPLMRCLLLDGRVPPWWDVLLPWWAAPPWWDGHRQALPTSCRWHYPLSRKRYKS